MEMFLKDRKKAFKNAVMKDDWNGFKKYCKKYHVPIPKSEVVMKAGCYKAVQECTDIPDEVKQEAKRKCLELGFYPYIRRDDIPIAHVGYDAQQMGYDK